MAVIMYLDLREKVNAKDTNFEYFCKELLTVNFFVDYSNCSA